MLEPAGALDLGSWKPNPNRLEQLTQPALPGTGRDDRKMQTEWFRAAMRSRTPPPGRPVINGFGGRGSRTPIGRTGESLERGG